VDGAIVFTLIIMRTTRQITRRKEQHHDQASCTSILCFFFAPSLNVASTFTGVMFLKDLREVIAIRLCIKMEERISSKLKDNKHQMMCMILL